MNQRNFFERVKSLFQSSKPNHELAESLDTFSTRIFLESEAQLPNQQQYEYCKRLVKMKTIQKMQKLQLTQIGVKVFAFFELSSSQPIF